MTASSLLLLTGAIVFSAAASLPALWLPWYGDQALFAYGARSIASGDRLYVDFWDNKQPGVYWFFLAGGRLFGSFGLGPRLLELASLTLASLVSALGIRAAGFSRAPVAFTPLATLAVYYAMANSPMLTQVESLVALPLATCVLLLQVREKHRIASMVACGACAAVVPVLKLVLFPIPLAIVAATLFLQRLGPREWASAAMWLGIGGALVVGAAVLPFLIQGSSSEAWWTAIRYPMHALQEVAPAPPQRLLGSAWLFVRALGPVIALAAWGFVVALRRPAEPARRLVIVLAVWIVFSVFTILVQRLSWWAYHFTLLVWPLGMLGAIGAGDLVARYGSLPVNNARRVALLAAVTVLALPVAYRIGRKAVRIARLASDGAMRAESVFVDSDSPAEQAIRHVPPTPEGCRATVYVFGDPTILLATSRPSALAAHGWGWEVFLHGQWARLSDDLRGALADAIYLDAFYRDLIRREHAALLDGVMENYEVAWVGNAGDVWLVRRGPRQPGACGKRMSFVIPAER